MADSNINQMRIANPIASWTGSELMYFGTTPFTDPPDNKAGIASDFAAYVQSVVFLNLLANGVSTFRPLGTNTYTGTSYTFQLTDANKYVRASNGSAQTFTIPLNASVAFPIGTEIDLIQAGAGQLSIAATGGVTINSKAGHLSFATQYSAATLKKIATDTWDLVGDLS